MATGRVRTSTPGDPKKLKAELKDSGNDKWFYRVQANTDFTARFMAEPWEFTSYMQHFMEKTGFPCNDGDCKGCDEGNQASKVWVAPVLDVENKRVRAMQVPKSIVDKLSKMAERQGTIQDRDMTISREGSTKDDTKYDVYPEGRKRRDMTPFELPDIEGMLEDMLDEAVNSDDEDDEPPRRKGPNKTAKKVSSTATKKRRSTDEDDEPWENDEDDDDEPPRRRSSTGAARKSVKKAVKKVARKPATQARRSLRRN